MQPLVSVAPAVLLLKRPVRNKLPQANHIDPVSEIIRERASSQKSKIKLYADNKAYVKPCTISPAWSKCTGQEAIFCIKRRNCL